MPQPCSICVHPQRQEIDRDLLSGVPLRKIAEQCSVSVTALHRHKTGGHIAQALTQAREVEEVARADTLLIQVHELLERARSITDQAEDAGDLRAALQGIREVRGILELLLKATGELQSGTMVNIALVTSPEWINLRTAILRALEPFPAAADAIINAFETVPGAQGRPPRGQITIPPPRNRNGISPVRLSDRIMME